MIKIKNVLPIFAFVVAFLGSDVHASSQPVFISAVSSIKVTVPVARYTENSVIPVSVNAQNIKGPLYLYLYNPSNKSVAVTEVYNVTSSSNSNLSLDFHLAKYKSSSHIKSGDYKVAVCDVGIKFTDPVCASSEVVNLSPSAPTIESLSSDKVFANSSFDVFGSGFDQNSFAYIDGQSNNIATTKFVSDEHLVVSFTNGLSYGQHNLSIYNPAIYQQSNVLNFRFEELNSPVLSRVQVEQKGSDNLFTLTGDYMTRVYPTTVELIRYGRVESVINPTANNAYAISDDGKMMKFILKDKVSLEGLFVRIRNGEIYQSMILPVSF